MKKNTGIASIFDNLEYEHRDLNEVDETSPLYQPRLVSEKPKKSISFYLPPQEMVDSDTGFTSDDLSSHRYAPPKGLSEMDKLLALSAQDFSHDERPIDCFSEMFGLAMEDSNTVPENIEDHDELGYREHVEDHDEFGFSEEPEEIKSPSSSQTILHDDDSFVPIKEEGDEIHVQNKNTEHFESRLDDDDDLIPDFPESIETTVAASSYQEKEKVPELSVSPKKPVPSSLSKKTKVLSKEGTKKRRVATSANTKSKSQ